MERKVGVVGTWDRAWLPSANKIDFPFVLLDTLSCVTLAPLAGSRKLGDEVLFVDTGAKATPQDKSTFLREPCELA
jgi:hypothetical protein